MNHNSRTIKVLCPDGKMFVTICEDSEGVPNRIIISIGKTGTALMAWANAAALLSSRLLPFVGIPGLIQEISNITTSSIRSFGDGIKIRSGPEALAYALMRYQAVKSLESDNVK